jgi:hypothetical protein
MKDVNFTQKSVMDWVWILYPLVVIIFVVVGLNWMFGNNSARFLELTGAKKQLDLQQADLSRLRQKEAMLKSVDVTAETENLKRLTAVMPATKKVWLLVDELTLAATESGSTLQDFNGQVGSVKEATGEAAPRPVAVASDSLHLEASYNVESFDQVKSIVVQLSKSLPLVQISKISFIGKRLILEVNGAWSNWTRVANEAQNTLPDYALEVAEINNMTSGYNMAAQFDQATGDYLRTENPF